MKRLGTRLEAVQSGPWTIRCVGRAQDSTCNRVNGGLKFPWFHVKAGTLTVEGRRPDGPGTFHADLPPDGS